jgi:hypothetical protein
MPAVLQSALGEEVLGPTVTSAQQTWSSWPMAFVSIKATAAGGVALAHSSRVLHHAQGVAFPSSAELV